MPRNINEDLTIGENTYVVDTTDPHVNTADRARLLKQEALINEQMKVQLPGLLPPGYGTDAEIDVLDVACGTAGWIRDVSNDYPHAFFVGIDNNKRIIDYARNHEGTKHNENVSFELMNLMEPLGFADATFDFVNMRFLTGVVPTDKWVDVLKECVRVLKPGGHLRITESEMTWASEAPAYWQACDLLVEMMHSRGRSFARHSISIAPMLPFFFVQAGCVKKSIRMTLLSLDWSAGTNLHESVVDDMRMSLQILREPILKMGKLSQEEYDQLYENVIKETSHEGFRAIWPLVSVLGRKPE